MSLRIRVERFTGNVYLFFEAGKTTIDFNIVATEHDRHGVMPDDIQVEAEKALDYTVKRLIMQ